MYKLIKQAGNNVMSVINTDIHAVVNISIPTFDMIHKLKDRGISEDLLKLSKEWDIPISKELANDLLESTMHMRKPMRNQSKKSEQIQQDANAKDLFNKNKNIDAMDVLLGLAKYV